MGQGDRFCLLHRPENPRALNGAVLYVLGPLVISLIPAFGVGSLARAYFINLMAFHFWGIIYAVLGALMAAVNLSTVQDVLTADSFIGGFVGLEQSLLLGLRLVLELIGRMRTRSGDRRLGETCVRIRSPAQERLDELHVIPQGRGMQRGVTAVARVGIRALLQKPERQVAPARVRRDHQGRTPVGRRRLELCSRPQKAPCRFDVSNQLVDVDLPRFQG